MLLVASELQAIMARFWLLFPVLVYVAGMWFPNVVETPLLAVSGPEVGLLLMALALPFLLSSSPTVPIGPTSKTTAIFSLGAIATFGLLIFVCTLPDIVWAGGMQAALRIVSREIFGFVLILYMWRVIERASELNLVVIWAGIGAIGLSLFLFPVFVDPGAYHGTGLVGPANRIAGTFGHPNQLGIVCSTIMSLFVLAPFRRGRLFVDLCVVPACLAVVVMTGSKANITFCVVVICLTYALRFYLERAYAKLTLTILMAPVVVVGLFVTIATLLATYQPEYFETVLELLRSPTEAGTVMGRGDLWGNALAGFASSPLLGVGPVAASDYLGVSQAHNLTLDVLLRSGLVGFVGYLLWLAACGTTAWRAHRKAAAKDEPEVVRLSWAVIVAFGVYFVANHISDSASPETARVFYFVWAVGLVTLRLAEAEATGRQARPLRPIGPARRRGCGCEPRGQAQGRAALLLRKHGAAAAPRQAQPNRSTASGRSIVAPSSPDVSVVVSRA